MQTELQIIFNGMEVFWYADQGDHGKCRGDDGGWIWHSGKRGSGAP